MTNEDIIREGQQTVKAFLDQLDGPNDIYKQIVMEEVLKFLYAEILKDKSLTKDQAS